ncbi:hypothetical protein RRG08_047302 [Elysia crispata]|uniref:Uncharacterized protein n=1 Tax=Elysia crispata TaxID=231223 RepID=A0AAE0YY97_9GAST|nr:hypothetical protein RRG08_047302 [Elysia crispata]
MRIRKQATVPSQLFLLFFCAGWAKYWRADIIDKTTREKVVTGHYRDSEETAVMPSVSTILILGVLLAVTICCQAITMCSYDASLCGFKTEKGVIRLKKYADRYFSSQDPANPYFN